jgi:hypothetical protein
MAIRRASWLGLLTATRDVGVDPSTRKVISVKPQNKDEPCDDLDPPRRCAGVGRRVLTPLRPWHQLFARGTYVRASSTVEGTSSMAHRYWRPRKYLELRSDDKITAFPSEGAAPSLRPLRLPSQPHNVLMTSAVEMDVLGRRTLTIVADR